MELTQPTLVDAEVARSEIAERIARASTMKIPASAHRQLLAHRMRRVAARLEN